ATRLRDFRHPLTLALKCPSPTAIPPLSLHDALPICPAPATGSPVSDAHHTPHPRHAATQPPRHAAGGFRRWARRALGPAPATLGLRHGAVPGRAPITRGIRLAPAPPVASSCPGAELVPWYRARAVAPSSCRGAELVPGPARPRQRSTTSTAKHELGSAARPREAHRLPRRTSAPAGASSYPRAELVARTVRARHRGTSSRHGAGHDEGPHRTVRAFVTLSGGRH